MSLHYRNMQPNKIIYISHLLLCAVVYTRAERGANFNCTSEDDVGYVILTSPSPDPITFLSPCFPHYYSHCSYHDICHVTIANFYTQSWSGLFIDQSLCEKNWILDYDKFILSSPNSTISRQILLWHLCRDSFYRIQTPANHVLTLSFDGRNSAERAATGPLHLDGAVFRVEMRFAYTMENSDGSSRTIPAGSEGYIVSHESFDSGNYQQNYYTDNQVSELTLTNYLTNYTLHMTFLVFELYNNSLPGNNFEDYLEIIGVSGFINNTVRFFGDNTSSSYELVLVGNNVTFKFVTGTTQGLTAAQGFLLHYKVECPSPVPNTKPAEYDQGLYIIECETGYQLNDSSVKQEVNCNSTSWPEAILPCLPKPTVTSEGGDSKRKASAVGGTIGGIIGGLIGATFGVICGWRFYKRRQKRRHRDETRRRNQRNNNVDKDGFSHTYDSAERDRSQDLYLSTQNSANEHSYDQLNIADTKGKSTSAYHNETLTHNSDVGNSNYETATEASRQHTYESLRKGKRPRDGEALRRRQQLERYKKDAREDLQYNNEGKAYHNDLTSSGAALGDGLDNCATKPYDYVPPRAELPVSAPTNGTTDPCYAGDEDTEGYIGPDIPDKSDTDSYIEPM